MVHDGQATVSPDREELQPGRRMAVNMRSNPSRHLIVFRERLLAASGTFIPDQVASFMGRGKVFCPPSIVVPNGDTEGLRLVNLEAQAAGAPTVTFASGGVPEGIDDGVTGIVPRPSP